jgi:hypothetical protein
MLLDPATAALTPLSAMRRRRPRPAADNRGPIRKMPAARPRKAMSLVLMTVPRPPRTPSFTRARVPASLKTT